MITTKNIATDCDLLPMALQDLIFRKIHLFLHKLEIIKDPNTNIWLKFETAKYKVNFLRVHDIREWGEWNCSFGHFLSWTLGEGGLTVTACGSFEHFSFPSYTLLR